MNNKKFSFLINKNSVWFVTFVKKWDFFKSILKKWSSHFWNWHKSHTILINQKWKKISFLVIKSWLWKSGKNWEIFCNNNMANACWRRFAKIPNTKQCVLKTFCLLNPERPPVKDLCTERASHYVWVFYEKNALGY